MVMERPSSKPNSSKSIAHLRVHLVKSELTTVLAERNLQSNLSGRTESKTFKMRSECRPKSWRQSNIPTSFICMKYLTQPILRAMWSTCPAVIFTICSMAPCPSMTCLSISSRSYPLSNTATDKTSSIVISWRIYCWTKTRRIRLPTLVFAVFCFLTQLTTKVEQGLV
eukprot:19379_5